MIKKNINCKKNINSDKMPKMVNVLEANKNPIKPSIVTFYADKRKMFMNYMETFYDAYVSEKIYASENPLSCMYEAFINSEKMIRLFKEGNTVLLVPELMDQIEKLDTEKKPFIIVIMDHNEVFAIIPSQFAEY